MKKNKLFTTILTVSAIAGTSLMTYASVATPSNATENDYGISLMSTNDGGQSGDYGFDFDIEVPDEPEEIIINLTNTKTDESVIVKGTKTWEDLDNAYGIRPDSITLNLYADGEEIYCCRGDLAGVWYDRKAMLIASRNLGHNRVDVIAGHYLR